MKAFTLASELPFVQIYDTEKMGLELQGFALQHCLNEAHLARKAEWIADFDVDEVFAFGDPIFTKDCDNDKDYLPEGALSKFTKQLPQSVLGIVVPRLNFGQNFVKTPPAGSAQMELYTRRSAKVSYDGKVMRRATVDGSIVQDSHHDFRSKGRDSGKYSNGKPAHLKENCTKDTDICWFDFGGIEFISLTPVQIDDQAKEHLSFPRLHHYVSRSLDDCLLKVADCNTTRLKSLNVSPWRLAENSCDENLYSEVEDFSLYCVGKKVSEELSQLYLSL